MVNSFAFSANNFVVSGEPGKDEVIESERISVVPSGGLTLTVASALDYDYPKDASVLYYRIVSVWIVEVFDFHFFRHEFHPCHRVVTVFMKAVAIDSCACVHLPAQFAHILQQLRAASVGKALLDHQAGSYNVIHR